MTPTISIQEECSPANSERKFPKIQHDFKPPMFTSLSQPFVGREVQNSINQFLRTWQPPLKENNTNHSSKNNVSSKSEETDDKQSCSLATNNLLNTTKLDDDYPKVSVKSADEEVMKEVSKEFNRNNENGFGGVTHSINLSTTKHNNDELNKNIPTISDHFDNDIIDEKRKMAEDDQTVVNCNSGLSNDNLNGNTHLSTKINSNNLLNPNHEQTKNITLEDKSKNTAHNEISPIINNAQDDKKKTGTSDNRNVVEMNTKENNGSESKTAFVKEKCEQNEMFPPQSHSLISNILVVSSSPHKVTENHPRYTCPEQDKDVGQGITNKANCNTEKLQYIKTLSQSSKLNDQNKVSPNHNLNEIASTDPKNGKGGCDQTINKHEINTEYHFDEQNKTYYAGKSTTSVSISNERGSFKQDLILQVAQLASEAPNLNSDNFSQSTDLAMHSKTETVREFPQRNTDMKKEVQVSEDINKDKEIKEMINNTNPLNHTTAKHDISENKVLIKKQSSNIHQPLFDNGIQSNNFQVSIKENVKFRCSEKQNNSIKGNDLTMEEDFYISHSQLDFIEDKCKQVLKVGESKNFDKNVPRSSVQTYEKPLEFTATKINWTQQLQDSRQKLRLLIQEISRLNAMLTKIRREIWPTKKSPMP